MKYLKQRYNSYLNHKLYTGEYNMKIHWDSLCGWALAVVFVCIIGKIYIVPCMEWWEVLWVVVKGQVGM